MNCRKYRKGMYEYGDGSLSQERKQEMRAHLSVCEECSDRVEREARMSSLLKNALDYKTSSLVVDPSIFLRLKEKKDRKKPPVFVWRGADFVSKPVTILIAVLMISLSIFVFYTPKSDRGTAAWLKNRAAEFFLEEDMIMTDPKSDWLERRLVVIIVDKKQKSFGKIVTSKNPEETKMFWENREAQK